MRAGWQLLLSIEINARECSAAPSRLTQCMSLTLRNDLFTQPRCQPALHPSLFYLELDCNICDRRNKGEIGMSRFERLVATCKCDFAKNENGLSGENDHQESEPLSLTPAAKQVGCQVKCKVCSSRPAMLLDQLDGLFRLVEQTAHVRKWIMCNDVVTTEQFDMKDDFETG